MQSDVLEREAPLNAQGWKTVRLHKSVGRGQTARRKLLSVGAIAAAVLLVGVMVAPLSAQSYPSRPIRLIMPFPAGGSTDILGRLLGAKLAERLGQPMVPENHAGAGSAIGIDLAAKAKPDGYTILLASSTLAIGPSLYKRINIDPIKELTPITLTFRNSYVLVVSLALPAKNLTELIELTTANPGKFVHGSSGVGSMNQLAFELFKNITKVNILHVPYKGAGQMMTALLSGEINMMVSPYAAALAQIKAGKARALAVLDNRRSPQMPDVPTAKEAGLDHWEVISWYGLLGPAKLPRDIASRISEEWAKIAAVPDTAKQIEKAGVEPTSSTPEQFTESLKENIALWAKVIKEANIPRID